MGLPASICPAALRRLRVAKKVRQRTAGADLSALLASMRPPRSRNASPLGLQGDSTSLVQYVTDSNGKITTKGSTVHYNHDSIIVAKAVSHKQLPIWELTAPYPYTFWEVFDPASIIMFEASMKEKGYNASYTEGAEGIFRLALGMAYRIPLLLHDSIEHDDAGGIKKLSQ